MTTRVVLASPRGFCAGVVRAVDTVTCALERFRPPVYVRRAIVHNARVVERLAAAGAVFVDELCEVPVGGVVILGAHGVARSVRDEARARGLRVIDATCPLVAKVHREVRRYRAFGYDVVLIGRAGHDEVVGTLGQAPGVQLVETIDEVPLVRVVRRDRVACVTQTTLRPEEVAPIVEALRRRFPALVQPACADICYATRNRQLAVDRLTTAVDAVVVVGDRHSSNTQRLREAAEAGGTPAYLVGSAAEVDDTLLASHAAVGLTAGASTPKDVVAEVVERFISRGADVTEIVVAHEELAFALPPELGVLPAGGA
ncbi:MAG TPA: 4-hydroxy-3-methylbut-2-enyl diphosphate reductase [Candidatus Limnocylindrales bacterium]|nr:4-hydroxy-3-methylbut-2-enyl diphosphate reductase [Candidatus Limnocylindrales bacterium]